MKRCSWVNLDNPLYISYHDNEWGRVHHDDKYLIELFFLESMQAGLSWEIILNKRKAFNEAFDNFDIDKIINYDEDKINSLMNNKNIIRNRRKIDAVINNSKYLKNIISDYGSFDKYIWSFTNNKTIRYKKLLTESSLSRKISKDLIKRGFKFVGPTIIYSYLESIGVINSHSRDCYLFIDKN